MYGCRLTKFLQRHGTEKSHIRVIENLSVLALVSPVAKQAFLHGGTFTESRLVNFYGVFDDAAD